MNPLAIAIEPSQLNKKESKQGKAIQPRTPWRLYIALLGRLPVVLILWSVCLLLTGCGKRQHSLIEQPPIQPCIVTSNDLTLGYTITLNDLKPAYQDEYFEIFFKERQAEAIWNSICYIDPKILAGIDVSILDFFGTIDVSFLNFTGLQIFYNHTAIDALRAIQGLLFRYKKSMQEELQAGIIAYIHHSKKIAFKKFLQDNGLGKVWELLNQATLNQSLELNKILPIDPRMQSLALKCIFEFIECYLPELVELDLSDNSLTTLPACITNLSNLCKLKVSYNYLRELPEFIGNLSNLRELDVYHNYLRELPASIGNLSNLSVLNVSYNRLTVLPDCIGNLPNLSNLNVFSNRLTTLPASIGNLSNLRKLNVGNNNSLNKLPACIGKLSNLRQLNVGHSNLTELPAFIGNLSNLSHLELYGNKLTTLPESIGNLSKLRSLAVGFNQVQVLPHTFGSLIELNRLDLCNNKLTALPESFEELTNLSYLELSCNNLTSLPGLQKLTNLSEFRASHNPLLQPNACQGMGVLLTSSNLPTILFPSLKELAFQYIVYKEIPYNTTGNITLPDDCFNFKTYRVILFTKQLPNLVLGQPIPITTNLSYKQILVYLSTGSQIILIQ